MLSVNPDEIIAHHQNRKKSEEEKMTIKEARVGTDFKDLTDLIKGHLHAIFYFGSTA